MSVESGFHNSLNGDRKYNARHISMIFDGIIKDGIFASIGTAFGVKASSGNTVTVGVGRAWFNGVWLYNDSILPITLPDSEILLDRYDAIVIEIDNSDMVRAGSIKVLQGTPSSDPKYPELIRTTEVNQYPLCYISRKKQSTSITQADIINAIGMDSTPYALGILETQSIEKSVAQWEAEWDQWTAAEKAEFDAWMATIHDILDGETATNLANEITRLQNRVTTLENQVAYLTKICEHVIVDSGYTEE